MVLFFKRPDNNSTKQENEKVKTYLSPSMCVFQCHHGIRENVSRKTRKTFGGFNDLHR